MIQISNDEARALIEAIKMHEAARSDFCGEQYTDEQSNAITGLIVKVGR